MFKIAVCDDEALLAEQIKNIIESEKNIPGQVDIYHSGKKLLESGCTYDLIFLDIGMKDMSGIETGKRIRQYDHKVKIVFITAYNDYAAAAFDVHAFSYILKPVIKEKLLKVMNEAYQWFLEEEKTIKLEFNTTEGIAVIEIRQIYYFEYENRKIKMVTSHGNYYLNAKITDMYHRMGDYGFEMPHKSFIVNLCHIRTIIGLDIMMTNGDMVVLSQKKASSFRKKLFEFIDKQIPSAKEE